LGLLCVSASGTCCHPSAAGVLHVLAHRVQPRRVFLQECSAVRPIQQGDQSSPQSAAIADRGWLSCSIGRDRCNPLACSFPDYAQKNPRYLWGDLRESAAGVSCGCLIERACYRRSLQPSSSVLPLALLCPGALLLCRVFLLACLRLLVEGGEDLGVTQCMPGLPCLCLCL
jgi:hypothetical protein